MKQVYVDLDGVLTDFSKQLAELLNKPLDRTWDFGNDPEVWKKIDGAGEDFWSEMKWMPDGHKLWDFVKKFDPTILTAPSDHPSSKSGKKIWLEENLPDVPYIIESKKEKHAKEGYVLIDDREKNINKWKKAGGIGILHKDADTTIKELEGLMEDKEKDASSIDYSEYLIYTPKDGGEYYGLSIPKDVTPPKEGVKLNIGGVDLIVFTVRTPMDIAKGRGGPVADSMLENGIGWRVNCLPPKHEYIRRASMLKTIESLDAAADALEALGMVKEAFHLDKVADRWEEFLKAQKAGPETSTQQEMFPKAQIKKLLWGSGDKRLQTVKDVLENIVKRRKGTDIPREKLIEVEDVLKELRKASVTEFTSQADIDAVKKQIHNKIFNINPNLAELVGLLFVTPANKMERMHNESEIGRLAKPYLLPERRDPLQSDFGRSRMFNEMKSRYSSIDLSVLSDDQAKLVSACMDRVAVAMEKYASLELYLAQFIDSIMKHRPDTGTVMKWLTSGINEKQPVPEGIDKQKAMANAWKKAIGMIVDNPKDLINRFKSYKIDVQQAMDDPSKLKSIMVQQIAKALKLKSGVLAENTMPIEDWAQFAGMGTPEFVSLVDTGNVPATSAPTAPGVSPAAQAPGGTLAPKSEPPLGNNRNPAVVNKGVLAA